jgi:predicted enzyme related to lactoylglutathione lyase
MINTTDVPRLVKFWSEVLGVEVRHEYPDFTFLHAQTKGGISINFQRVPNPTEGRRRLHLDASVADLDAATERIIELGGAHLEDHGTPTFAWRVMADPDGNEFCISARH